MTDVLAPAAAAAAATLLVLAVLWRHSRRPTLPGPVTPPSSRARRHIPVDRLIGVVATGLCLASPVPALAPIVGLVAWRLPSFLAAHHAKRRLSRVDAEIPQLLDLLAAGSSAGLSASLSLRRAIDALEGPLAAELDGVIRAVDLGGRWRDELREAADRLRLPDLRRTVTALTRTDTLGSSLASSMTDLAARVRASRRALVTERARTAPVKMLFPLVFLVLPAFLLLTVVPVLLTTVQSIR
jgi:tight adherence protein C